MKELDGVKLGDLLQETSGELFAERRKQAKGIIKKLLTAQEQLVRDIDKLEKQLKKHKKQLEKKTEVLDKISKGDWSLVVESQEQKKKED